MIGLVIPSNRPDSLARWEREWKAQWEARPDLRVYIVRDEPATWAAIRQDLGAAAWIIPIRTDCIRSYGFYCAWRDGADLIATLDDDCYPSVRQTGHWLDVHTAWLRDCPPIDPASGWVSTTYGVAPRGLPRRCVRPTMLSMGGWTGVPDVDAETQLAGYGEWGMLDRYVPAGVFFPMSGMNLAWRRDLTPALYFGLMGTRLTDPDEDWGGMHRYGDIWAGLFAKRICDHLGYSVHTGTPLVQHDRASDPHVNLEREAVAREANEWLWKIVGSEPLSETTVVGAYHQLADGLARSAFSEYWRSLADAMHRWADLFR